VRRIWQSGWGWPRVGKGTRCASLDCPSRTGWTAAGLVNELLQAQQELRLHKLIASALKLDLVILDELGFIPFSPSGAQVLFTFCSEIYERVAMVLTTNLKFADWTQVFGDERLTAALLDRLTHHASILELIGESYRFRERLAAE
jgi:DNA replication protein DnaC